MNDEKVQPHHRFEMFTVEDEPGAYVVYDSVAQRSFRVQKLRGRYVGPCSCAEEPSRMTQCRHQAAVRECLMNQWYFGKRPHQR